MHVYIKFDTVDSNIYLYKIFLKRNLDDVDTWLNECTG